MRTERSTFHGPSGLGVFELMAQAMMQPDRSTRRASTDEADGTAGSQRSDASAQPPEGTRRRSLLERLERWFWEIQQRDVEAYLAQASDIHDLESRIRMLERRGLHAHF